MSWLLIALVVSGCLTLWLVRRAGSPGSIAQDQPLSGPQKFHARPVPRIGGVGILVGLVAGAAWATWRDSDLARTMWGLLACSMPAFLAGLAEDLTKRVSPARRLFFTAVAAALLAQGRFPTP